MGPSVSGMLVLTFLGDEVFLSMVYSYLNGWTFIFFLSGTLLGVQVIFFARNLKAG
jgi:ABC-type molybdate transport system permease subunit